MVRLGLLTAAAALVGSAFSAPFTNADLKKRADIDLVVLQFALTLEHLENVFYKEALQKFTAADFVKAGFANPYYTNLEYIAFDEQTHVVALEAAIKGLGAAPVKACKYSFPYTDVASFVALSEVLENVGTSAYTGAASLITSPYYLTVAATILDVEAIHTSYQRAELGLVPMANPFETPLDPTSVFTLASAFIVSCPPHNYPLPFTAFAGLTAVTTSASAGDTFTATASGKVPAWSWLTFVNGLAVSSVKATVKGTTVSAVIPDTIVGGQTYVFVTSKPINGDFSDFNDALVLYGPAIYDDVPAAPKIDYSIL